MEKVENLIISVGIDNTIDKLSAEKATREELEKVDTDITYIVNTVRRKIKGSIRKVPFSKTKFKKQIKLLHWKVMLYVKQGKRISKDKIKQRRLLIGEEK